MNIVRFYKVGDKFGNFSNFALFPIYIDNEIWPSVEHYFQASKFESNEIRLLIKSMKSPMKAANEGRSKNNRLRHNWDAIKDDVMFNALTAKFFQHPSLKREILDTGNALIIEDTINDNYWGNGGDDKGKNKLGKLLMEVRENINTISNDVNIVFPPWIAFPGIDQYDLFWRMGLGEEYLDMWAENYLNQIDKEHYQLSFPPPPDWLDVYI